MKHERMPDVFPALAPIVEEKRNHLVAISAMMLEVCQHAVSTHYEHRRFFGLDLAEAKVLREAAPERIYYISNRCLYPWRPERKIASLLDQGPSTEEYSLCQKALGYNDNVVNNLRILWSTYIFSLQRFLKDNPESWMLLGIGRDDSGVLRAASANTLRKLVLQGPYILTPSTSLRGLLSPRGVLRHDELLRRSALDLGAARSTPCNAAAAV